MREVARRATVLVALVSILPAEASAEGAACPPRCTLGDLRERAAAHAPEVARAEAAVRFGEARRDEAWALPLRLGNARMELEPTALRRGDVEHFEERDVSWSSEMGLSLRLRLYAVLPVTSWWRIASAVRAADAGVDLARGDLERRRAEARLSVERAFRDLQLARERSRALRRAHAHVTRALAATEMLLEEDLPGATEPDRLRLELSLADLASERAEARRAQRRAEVRVRALARLPRGTRIETPPLAEPPRADAPLAWHLEAARRQRPEARMSLAAIRGGEGLLALQLGELVPDLGVVGYYSFRGAPLVDDQRSPFAYDPWNGLAAGYGAALEWQLDPVGTAQRVRQARADLDQASALRRLALGGIAFQVESAYAEVVAAEAALGARRRGRDAAAGWLEATQADLGTRRADARDASRAVGTWLAQEVAWQRAARDLLCALAELEAAAGHEPGSLTGPEVEPTAR